MHYVPFFEKLLQVLVKQCVVDENDEESGNFREISQQTFLAIFDMLGQRYLETLCNQLQVTSNAHGFN